MALELNDEDSMIRAVFNIFRACYEIGKCILIGFFDNLFGLVFIMLNFLKSENDIDNHAMMTKGVCLFFIIVLIFTAIGMACWFFQNP